MDPFVDLIQLLRPKATAWGRLESSERWGFSFRKRDDLLFFWLARGECQLILPHAEPLHLKQDDLILLRASTPFTIASDADVQPRDVEDEVSRSGSNNLIVGNRERADVILHGGRFDFDTANEDLLTSMLPPLVHVAAEDTSSSRVRSLMQMNHDESEASGPGSAYIIARLMELILIEILRGESLRVGKEQIGLFAGLADSVTSRALAAMHSEPGRNWTVAELARLSMVSRSTFATRFQKRVGMGPIEYLQHWRMALAKDELRLGRRSIGEIALAVGFQASSAFSAAFTRAEGYSPKRFAEIARTAKDIDSA
ncbi:AraC family transcriptional regulator [Silvibacterium acidisoli]|uniref:AraC family transcriptional regulator n=1 Tax=Acidobacteriaceae bacterium ZG23-2 TaxID=2883246 RepID=UPI00406C67A5